MDGGKEPERYDADVANQLDVNMADILKKPDDAIAFIEAYGVKKLGSMEVDVSLPSRWLPHIACLPLGLPCYSRLSRRQSAHVWT